MNIFITILAVSFGFWGLLFICSRLVTVRLKKALVINNIDEFDQISSRNFTKKFVPLSNILALKLNYALSNDNASLVDEMAGEIINAVVPKNDKGRMLIVIFQYYMVKSSKDKLFDLLPDLKTILSSNDYHECKMAYDINLNGSYAYIDEFKEDMDIADAHEKGMKAFMIAKQYENKQDQRLREKYLEEAFLCLKGTPFESVVINEISK
jgi:hypothetical protein